MKNIFSRIPVAGLMICCISIVSCNKFSVFPHANDSEQSAPKISSSQAVYLWDGPLYKVAVSALIEDSTGVSKIRVKNGEWKLDTVFTIANSSSYAFVDTLLVSKDVTPTEHVLEFIATNTRNNTSRENIAVADSSGKNLDTSYHADVVPPVIALAKPTAAITRFYGLQGENPTIDIDATATDEQIASVEVRVWGETADGTPVSFEDVIAPASDAEKKSFRFTKTYNFPDEKVGKYQYLMRVTDASGNKSTKSGDITVGYMDRLYLSDAESQDEILNQGVDQGGACYGIGTLLSMKKQSENIFTIDYYYGNEPNSTVQFVATMGTKPLSVNGSGIIVSQLNYNYLFGMSAAESGKITGNRTEANNKLPVTQKGYYHITVDMTKRTVTAIPYTPVVDFSNTTKYPGWVANGPWDYLAVTSSCIVGSKTWTETPANTATTPKLMRDADNPYLFSGTFMTDVNNATNIQLSAPLVTTANGWFRLQQARASMKDDYGDLISIVDAVGVQSGGVNWGFSVISPAGKNTGTFKASYNLVTKRLRIVRTGD
jgi:hypothetical protein